MGRSQSSRSIADSWVRYCVHLFQFGSCFNFALTGFGFQYPKQPGATAKSDGFCFAVSKYECYGKLLLRLWSIFVWGYTFCKLNRRNFAVEFSCNGKFYVRQLRKSHYRCARGLYLRLFRPGANRDYRFQYFYDNSGNLIRRISKSTGEVTKYDYSSENHLLKISVFQNISATTAKKISSYGYDVLGRRIQKNVWDSANSTDPKKTYVRNFGYDGNEIILLYDGQSSLLARYAHSSLRTDDVISISVNSSGVAAGIASQTGSYQFVKDNLGSVKAIASSSGTILQRQNYSAYGELAGVSNGTNSADISVNPVLAPYFAYTGREFDEESGLYYYRARYYDPATGRFLQEDPQPGKTSSPLTMVNRHAYAMNLPTMITDPSGEFGFLMAFAWTAIYSAAISALQAGIQTDWGRKGGFWNAFGRNFVVNFAISAVGLFSAGIQAGFTNTQFGIGLGGVYNTSNLITRGFSFGFFQATGGEDILMHEVGHSINFALYGATWDVGTRLEDRFLGAGIFYGVHLIGSYGGMYNPITYITEGGADIWGGNFSQVRNYTSPGYPLGY